MVAEGSAWDVAQSRVLVPGGEVLVRVRGVRAGGQPAPATLDTAGEALSARVVAETLLRAVQEDEEGGGAAIVQAIWGGNSATLTSSKIPEQTQEEQLEEVNLLGGVALKPEVDESADEFGATKEPTGIQKMDVVHRGEDDDDGVIDVQSKQDGGEDAQSGEMEVKFVDAEREGFQSQISKEETSDGGNNEEYISIPDAPPTADSPSPILSLETADKSLPSSLSSSIAAAETKTPKWAGLLRTDLKPPKTAPSTSLSTSIPKEETRVVCDVFLRAKLLGSRWMDVTRSELDDVDAAHLQSMLPPQQEEEDGQNRRARGHSVDETRARIGTGLIKVGMARVWIEGFGGGKNRDLEGPRLQRAGWEVDVPLDDLSSYRACRYCGPGAAPTISIPSPSLVAAEVGGVGGGVLPSRGDGCKDSSSSINGVERIGTGAGVGSMILIQMTISDNEEVKAEEKELEDVRLFPVSLEQHKQSNITRSRNNGCALYLPFMLENVELPSSSLSSVVVSLNTVSTTISTGFSRLNAHSTHLLKKCLDLDRLQSSSSSSSVCLLPHAWTPSFDFHAAAGPAAATIVGGGNSSSLGNFPNQLSSHLFSSSTAWSMFPLSSLFAATHSLQHGLFSLPTSLSTVAIHPEAAKEDGPGLAAAYARLAYSVFRRTVSLADDDVSSVGAGADKDNGIGVDKQKRQMVRRHLEQAAGWVADQTGLISSASKFYFYKSIYIFFLLFSVLNATFFYRIFVVVVVCLSSAGARRGVDAGRPCA